MEKTVQAVYENGVLRLLEPIPLVDRQQVTVTISDARNSQRDNSPVVSSDEWAGSVGDGVSLEEFRRGLAGIRGTLSGAAIEERRDR